MDIDTAILSKVKSLIQQDMYPVGEILITRREGDPSSWLGFGVWERYAKHRMLVGYDADDAEFSTLDYENGSDAITLSVDNMPEHTHTGIALSAGDHSHEYNDFYNQGAPYLRGSGDSNASAYISEYSGNTGQSAEHEHELDIDTAGSGLEFSIMNPYKVVYIWKRTA